MRTQFNGLCFKRGEFEKNGNKVGEKKYSFFSQKIKKVLEETEVHIEKKRISKIYPYLQDFVEIFSKRKQKEVWKDLVGLWKYDREDSGNVLLEDEEFEGSNSEYLFSVGIPVIQKFIRENPEKWDDVVKLAKYLGVNSWMLFKLLGQMYFFFEKYPESWTDLFEVGENGEENKGTLLMFLEGIVQMKTFLENYPEKWRDIMELRKISGKNSWRLAGQISEKQFFWRRI